MKSTWVKLHRSMLLWQHYRQPSAKLVFIHLLLTADGEGVCNVSQRLLAEEIGLGRQAVREGLAALVASGEITAFADGTAGTRITICNWRKFQSNPKTTQLATQSTTQSNEFVNSDNCNDLSDADKIGATQLATQLATQEQPNAEVARVRRREEKIINKQNSRAREDGYPETAAEIQTLAEAEGIAMTADEAERFLAHWESVGWRRGNTPITKVRRLLKDWHLTGKEMEARRQLRQTAAYCGARPGAQQLDRSKPGF